MSQYNYLISYEDELQQDMNELRGTIRTYAAV